MTAEKRWHLGQIDRNAKLNPINGSGSPLDAICLTGVSKKVYSWKILPKLTSA